MMQSGRSVAGVVVAVLAVVVAISGVAHSDALSAPHGALECGQNPMHAIQLVAQRTSRLNNSNNNNNHNKEEEEEEVHFSLIFVLFYCTA